MSIIFVLIIGILVIFFKCIKRFNFKINDLFWKGLWCGIGFVCIVKFFLIRFIFFWVLSFFGNVFVIVCDFLYCNYLCIGFFFLLDCEFITCRICVVFFSVFLGISRNIGIRRLLVYLFIVVV